MAAGACPRSKKHPKRKYLIEDFKIQKEIKLYFKNQINKMCVNLMSGGCYDEVKKAYGLKSKDLSLGH